MDIETDFCVVGAGPAGLTLALLLARSGARVALVERSRSFDREFRGEILQPGGMRLLDELGVLAGARERGCHEHDKFTLVQHGRVLMQSDYRRLPGAHTCLLSIPQRHVLEELLERCERYDGFEYHSGRRVTGLIQEDGRVRGVVSDGPDGALRVRAHCVIGADGRYSKVRQLAGIADGRLDVFDQDVLWFKVPARGAGPREVRVFRETGSPVLAYTAYPDSVQFGWTLPHGGYKQLAGQGIGYIKEQLKLAIPPYAELIDAEITSLRDVSLLDVFSGCATEWVRDGLVLIGDSAHTHSPIGAQGINLAIQDAVLLHPLLMASLRAGDASAGYLRRFERARRPDIYRILRIQVLQSRAMLSSGALAARLRPVLARVVAHSPVYRRVQRLLAFGNPRIAIAADLFTADVPADTPATELKEGGACR
jgi:monooxygenase